MAHGYGVICFNKDGSFTYFARENEAPLATLKGKREGDTLSATAKGYKLALERLAPSGPNKPVARGTLTIGKKKIAVFGYRNEPKTKGGKSTLGITASELPEQDDCPW